MARAIAERRDGAALGGRLRKSRCARSGDPRPARGAVDASQERQGLQPARQIRRRARVADPGGRVGFDRCGVALARRAPVGTDQPATPGLVRVPLQRRRPRGGLDAVLIRGGVLVGIARAGLMVLVRVGSLRSLDLVVVMRIATVRMCVPLLHPRESDEDDQTGEQGVQQSAWAGHDVSLSWTRAECRAGFDPTTPCRGPQSPWPGDRIRRHDRPSWTSGAAARRQIQGPRPAAPAGPGG